MSMAVQTSYNFGFSKGVVGGLYDLSEHEVATRQAEGSTSFGIGVVVGTNRGIDVTAPTAESTSADFEGVIVHNSVMAEMDMDNRLEIGDKRTVGCLQRGKIWVKTGSKAVPTYKGKVFLITDGDEAGLFTSSDDTATKIELNACFLGVTDNGIANAVFYPAIPASAASAPVGKG